MSFPSSAHRDQQYRICGEVLAETAAGIGLPLESDTAQQWGETMAHLASADEIAEDTPEVFTDPAALVRALRLDDTNPHLVLSAASLLDANVRSHTARTIRQHFSARTDEAVFSTNLLRFQSTNHTILPARWRQIELLSIAGIHLDSLFDAREDGAHFPQFTARQLAMGSMVNFVRYTRKIRPDTLNSFRRAARKVKLDTHIVTKPLRLLGVAQAA